MRDEGAVAIHKAAIRVRALGARFPHTYYLTLTQTAPSQLVPPRAPIAGRVPAVRKILLLPGRPHVTTQPGQRRDVAFGWGRALR